jgi:hypothetical protein
MTLSNEDSHHLYSLVNGIKMMKSGRMRWEGHTACMRARMLHMDVVRRPEEYRPICR